jgi:2-polyprenyl-3-methyl-5-hydroxy-6-metoxy-1,4-benzoquinol methylase
LDGAGGAGMKMAESLMKSIAAAATPCKICGNSAKIFGVADFNRSCRDGRGLVMPLLGVPIYYHRCARCGFLFTTYFDAFTFDEFSEYIYNDDYIKVDPDYELTRPTQWAESLVASLKPHKDLRILDYGGGNGKMAELLAASDILNVVTYDPFVAKFKERPTGKFDFIVCAEVVEHSPTPKETFADITGFMAETSAVMIGTLLQPHDIQQQAMNWWYLGPRNGHVSLYSWAAMQHMAHATNCLLTSVNPGTHVLRRGQAAWLKGWVGK